MQSLNWDDFFALQRFGMTLGLDHIRSFCARLGDPQDAFPAVHIAGTNGKGTVAAVLDSILRASGLQVGLYTSPHLLHFRERIRADGKPIPDEDVFSFLTRHWEEIQKRRYTFFEVATAMALDYFRQRAVDVAVVEVGLGGTHDATRIVNPVLTVFTPVDFDHTDRLGGTLESIAADKAGILRPRVPAVTSVQFPPVLRVLKDAATARGTRLFTASELVEFADLSISPDGISGEALLHCQDSPFENIHFTFPLTGSFQLENLRTALACVCLLRETFSGLDESVVTRGVERVEWRGRLEVPEQNSRLVMDVGHNPAAVKAVLDAVRTLWQPGDLYVIFSALRDKDVIGMLKLLGREAKCCFLAPLPPPRGLNTSELKQKAAEAGLRPVFTDSVDAALDQATAIARDEDLVLVIGSHMLVQAALRHLDGKHCRTI